MEGGQHDTPDASLTSPPDSPVGAAERSSEEGRPEIGARRQHACGCSTLALVVGEGSAMSRLLVAALALAAGASAAPSLVLAPGLSGDARRATYESVTQTEVLAGVLRAAGVASAAGAEAAQRWEADLQVASAQRPRLVAVLLTEAYGSKQARAGPLLRCDRSHPPALTGALCPLVLPPGAPGRGGRVADLPGAGECGAGGGGGAGRCCGGRRGGCPVGGRGREPAVGLRLVPGGASRRPHASAS